MPYILDTDWAIQAFVGRDPASGILNRLASPGVLVSVVTIGELFEVAFNTVNPEARIESYRRFMAWFLLANVTEPIMLRFAEIRAYLRRRSEMISDFDIVIGATALEYDLTVLTFNIRHFARIPDVRLYQPT